MLSMNHGGDPGKPWLPNATVAWYQPGQCRLEVSAKYNAEDTAAQSEKVIRAIDIVNLGFPMGNPT